MRISQYKRHLPALGLGLTLLSWVGPIAFAQQPLPRPSTGSGAGTGTGTSAGGPGATGTGVESGTGLGGTSGRSQTPGGLIPSTAPIQGGRQTGPRPEPLTEPRIVRPGMVEQLFGKDEPPLVREANQISDPGERSLAMVRIARTSIFLGRPDLGHYAIFQAARDSQLEANRTLRDQRIVNVIQAALALAEEHMRDVAIIQVNTAEKEREIPLPAPRNIDRSSNFERGRQEWDLAFQLAFLVENRSSRTETLYRVVESQSLGSNSLVREPSRITGQAPDPTKLQSEVRDFADGLLGSAIENALKIERPVWRDRGLVAIASNAAGSGQFDRALQAARSIPQPEVRTDALLRVAEDLVVFGQPALATVAYGDAARTIATVPTADPRETLVGVLIDSLIAFGRFDDARTAAELYSNPANPPIALSAVAESQGRRNLADSARRWIDRESSPELRSLLYRKLNDGVLAAVEARRSSELSRGSAP